MGNRMVPLLPLWVPLEKSANPPAPPPPPPPKKGDPEGVRMVTTWRLMGTYDPNSKSTCSLLRVLGGAHKCSYNWGF